MTTLATDQWCQEYLQHFYKDESSIARNARFLNEERGFTKLNETVILGSTTSKIQVDVFGVIVNYTFPKPCKGSHKYSTTFFIIDPSFTNPAHSIGVIYFFNDIETQMKQLQIGDVVCLRNVYLGFYKNFPQIIGQGGVCTIHVFRNTQNYKENGLYSFSIPADMNGTVERERMLTDKEIQKPGSALQVNQSLLQGEWKIFPLSASKSIDPSLMDLISSLAVKALFFHAQTIFSTTTFADHTVPSNPHCTVHAILHSRSPTVSENSLGAYDELEPRSALPTRTEPFEKCDLIALVLDVLPGNQVNGTTFIVWDGTSNGKLLPTTISPVCKAVIQTSFNYCQAFHDIMSLPVDDPEKFNKDNFTEVKNRIKDVAPLGDGNEFYGRPLKLQAETVQYNYALARISAGTWVRIRNLRVDWNDQEKEVQGRICSDTHIAALSEYFSDSMSITQQYLHRVNQLKQLGVISSTSSNAPSASSVVLPSSSAALPPAPSSSSAGNSTSKVQEVKQRKKESNDDGIPYTPLAYCVSRPAPAKFACFGQLLGWSPRDPKDWIRVSPNIRTRRSVAIASPNYSFLFCLNMFDGTFALPVILYSDSAEEFLGISAQEAFNSVELQQEILEKLNSLKQSKEFIDFYVQSYYTAGTHRRQQKRFAIFNTKLGGSK